MYKNINCYDQKRIIYITFIVHSNGISYFCNIRKKNIRNWLSTTFVVFYSQNRLRTFVKKTLQKYATKWWIASVRKSQNDETFFVFSKIFDERRWCMDKYASFFLTLQSYTKRTFWRSVMRRHKNKLTFQSGMLPYIFVKKIFLQLPDKKILK